MHRQQRRRKKREWGKVKCDTVFDAFESKCMFKPFPFTCVDNFVKVKDDIAFRCVLSFTQVWRCIVYLVLDGFPFALHLDKVGFASDDWLVEYFEDDKDCEALELS